MKYLIAILVAAFALSAQSCHTLKTVSKSTKDSLVYVYHDTNITHETTVRKDSVVIHDSVIGISGSIVSVVLDHGSTVDTIIRRGSTQLHRYLDDKKREHIVVTNDSLTLVIQNMTKQNSWQDHRYEQLLASVKLKEQSHSEVEIKQEEKSWLGRTWDKVKNVFSWFGLLCLIALILWLVKRFVI